MIKGETNPDGTWLTSPMFDVKTTKDKQFSDVIFDAIGSNKIIPMELGEQYKSDAFPKSNSSEYVVFDKDEVRLIASTLLETVQNGPTKKIIRKDNFDRDVFTETVVAQNVPAHTAEEMVQAWQKEHWHSHSDSYLAVVDNDYVLYDGYKEMYGE